MSNIDCSAFTHTRRIAPVDFLLGALGALVVKIS